MASASPKACQNLLNINKTVATRVFSKKNIFITLCSDGSIPTLEEENHITPTATSPHQTSVPASECPGSEPKVRNGQAAILEAGPDGWTSSVPELVPLK